VGAPPESVGRGGEVMDGNGAVKWRFSYTKTGDVSNKCVRIDGLTDRAPPRIDAEEVNRELRESLAARTTDGMAGSASLGAKVQVAEKEAVVTALRKAGGKMSCRFCTRFCQGRT